MEQRRMSKSAFNRRLLQLVASITFGGVTLWGMYVTTTLSTTYFHPRDNKPMPVHVSEWRS
jgi:hypothetical protein